MNFAQYLSPTRFSSLLFKSMAAGLLCALFYAASAPSAPAFNDRARARAASAIRAGNYEQAEQLYRELLQRNARDLDSRLGLGFALYKLRRHQDAFDQAARVIAIDPTSARAHALLGTVLLSVGDFRLSVEEFRTALIFNEREAMAIAGLGMVDMYESRLPSSINYLRRAISLDPNEADYYYSFAQVAARAERYREAADAYEMFLRVAPRTDEDRRARIRGMISFLRYLGSQPTLYTLSSPSRAVIPFELVNSRPVFEVRVGLSRTPLRFVLDSGAGMCVISEETARRLGLSAVARGGVARAVGGGGRFEIVYGFLSSLQIGEARVENVPVYIRQFHNTQEQVDGYIGISALSKFLTTIDYRERTMTLLRGDERAAALATPLGPGAVELPIRTTSSGFWSSEVRIEGVESPLNFILDTGASVSVVSQALFEREELSRYAQATRMRIFGAAGVAENVRVLRLPRVMFGTHGSANVTAAVLDLEPINETSGFEQMGIIGGNVLRHFRITFDFSRGMIRLEPNSAPPADNTAPALGATPNL